MGDRFGQMLRADSWLDFEIAVHRVARAAPAPLLGSPKSRGRQQAGSRAVRWPADPLPVLQERRCSRRDLSTGSLSLDDLLDIVVPSFMTPSGRPAFARPGAVSAVSVTVLANRVDGLAQGVFSISPAACTLTCLRAAPFEAVSACVDLTDVSDPAAVLMLCLHMGARRKYANAYELALLEAGQLLQNLALTAAGAGVGACTLGSVFDEPFWAVVAPEEGNASEHGVPLVAVALGGTGSGSNEDGCP